ncbi:MBG domain-containing protein [Fibrobacter sp. UWB12]|uniref:MBG domain-containing protein n=1 Tax=Fibrobacter sp. UWB12 TaxID=1896203 RepID=UPI00091F85C5|nr:MBG domain-containing protein [Fibrobacter sp. UWB12]SHK20981.1 hypothetical protein SAMN05720759_101120 [Fibrobacter sp. UWB12]
MMKKIAMLAFAMSAAFSSAFAAGTCTVNISTNNLEFTGNQVKPTVKKVICGNDEFFESDFTKITYGKNINAGSDAGSVTVTLSNGDVATKTFEITPKGVHIVIDDVEKELGGKTPDLTWTIGEDSEMSTLNADTLDNFTSALNKNLKLVVAEGEEEVGAKFKISKDPSVNLTELFPNYDFLIDPASMVIIKTKINIVVTSTAKVYGESDPKDFKYDIVGNITAADYEKLGKITLARAEGENAGSYKISVSIDGTEYSDKPPKITGCEPAYCKETADYYIYAVSGTFVVQPAAATVTVDNVSKTYGEATPAFTYKATGLVGTDELKDVSLTCAKCSSTDLESVGEYAISASVNVKSNPNYKVTTKSGTLTVKKKAVTVNVDEAEKTYGDKDPKFTFTADGLVKGESLSGATLTRAEGEDVGKYKVSVDFAEGSNSNYTLTVVPGYLTITKKDVTLKVTNITKKFGEKDPELAYTVDGIVTLGGVEDELKGVALMREAGEDAGEYAITASVDEKSNPNYVVSTEDGKLTITANNDKIVVTVKGHTELLQYDGKEHTVKGFDISANSEAYSLKFVEYTGDSVVSGKDVGKYTMGLSASAFKNTSVNYTNVTFNITDGALQIDPRALVVTAKADTITYGDEIPAAFTWFADSLLEGDELDNIHVTLNKSGLLDAGEYALTFDQKNPTNSNYTVTKYVTNALTVKPKVVTVTVQDTSKFYSEADPEKYTYKVEGLLEGDELPELVLKRQEGENVLLDDETYAISATFAKEEPSKNYSVKIRQGEFTIKPCTQRITVAIYGENIVAKYNDGEEITVNKSFDVSPMRIPGEPWLPEEFAYKKEFVSYKGEMTMTEKELGDYPMGLVASDFVNISPNFENVNFVVTIDGSFKITDQETSIAGVKGVKAFGISAGNRSIQVSGSTVGKQFAVLDLQGRVVRKGVVESSNFEIPVPNTGIYMVRIGTSAQRVRVK